MRSKADKLRDKLAELLATERDNVDVFSVQLRRKLPAMTDVRFSAHGSPYYKPVRLNGIVLRHREEVILTCKFKISIANDEFLSATKFKFWREKNRF